MKTDKELVGTLLGFDDFVSWSRSFPAQCVVKSAAFVSCCAIRDWSPHSQTLIVGFRADDCTPQVNMVLEDVTEL